jgi:hypothetical protein
MVTIIKSAQCGDAVGALRHTIRAGGGVRPSRPRPDIQHLSDDRRDERRRGLVAYLRRSLVAKREWVDDATSLRMLSNEP